MFVICIKRTKWQRDLERYGDQDFLKRIYDLQNHAFEKVHSSHERQIQNLEKLQSHLPEAQYIFREDLVAFEPKPGQTLISLGGDNHFVYCARFAGNEPILAINSDPATSTGSLLYFDTESFLKKLERWKDPSTPIQPEITRQEAWTMIEAELQYPDGRIIRTGPCISEISIRNAFPDAMSRYVLSVEDEPPEEQKSSGLLIATGAGSTGWFRNCLPPSIQRTSRATFGREDPSYRIVAREPGFKAGRKYRYRYRNLETQQLRVISEMDGEFTIDAHEERRFPFPPATQAIIQLSEQRLHVVRDLKNVAG
ncbi:MAG: NAD+ kinase [Spirochaetaceae bacterium]|nr:NAD+ kinase [Spirochaetaceae bacterium]|tara:strand:+ start:25412 stop:26341 length:930 start_codon:yes stop_codon:yes gene_type:complete